MGNSRKLRADSDSRMPSSNEAAPSAASKNDANTGDLLAWRIARDEVRATVGGASAGCVIRCSRGAGPSGRLRVRAARASCNDKMGKSCDPPCRRPPGPLSPSRGADYDKRVRNGLPGSGVIGMRIDLYGLAFETPCVTFYLWSPW